MGYGHIVTIMNDYLLGLKHGSPDSDEYRQTELQMGRSILGLCLKAELSHERTQTGAGNGITHVDMPYKAEVGVYVWHGYVLRPAQDTDLELLQRARTQILIATLIKKNERYWWRLHDFFYNAYHTNNVERSDRAILQNYIAGRPRVAKQLRLALDYLLAEQPNDQDLAETLIWRMGCYFDPDRMRGMSRTAWVKRLQQMLKRLAP